MHSRQSLRFLVLVLSLALAEIAIWVVLESVEVDVLSWLVKAAAFEAGPSQLFDQIIILLLQSFGCASLLL